MTEHSGESARVVPCPECWWEEVRDAGGAFVRLALVEPCADHYEAAEAAEAAEPAPEGRPVPGCMVCATFRSEGRACPSHRVIRPRETR